MPDHLTDMDFLLFIAWSLFCTLVGYWTGRRKSRMDDRRRTEPPTEGQMQQLATLSADTGETLPDVETREAARAEIDRLKAKRTDMQKDASFDDV